MAFLKAAGFGVCFSLLGSTAVFADVTAEEVWQAWTKQYEGFGYTISTEGTDKSGDTLTVSGLKLVSTVDEASFEMQIPEVRLRELGDGTVEVTASKDITAKAIATATAEATTADGAPQPGAEPQTSTVEMDMAITQANAVTIVSGTPDNLSYAVTAPEMVMEMDQKVSGANNPVPVKFWLSATGLTGTYGMQQGEVQTATSDFTLGGVKMTASGADPDTGETFSLEAHLADLKTDSIAKIPQGVKMEDLGAALAAGADMSGAITYGAGQFSMDAQAAEGPVKLESAVESGRVGFDLSKAGFDYSASASGTSFAMTSAQMPIPVAGAMKESEFHLSAPLSASEEPQPFTGKITMIDLTVADALWAMFDPTGQLPHDPATLIVDLSGKMRPLVDLFSPEAATQGVPPVEFQSLDVNRVQLTLAGAELTGKGAVTFDNTMGMPMPLGALDLSLTGANGLMQKLVGMGLMPQDQTMFVNMMLGLYAKPAGDDAYTSTIEFKEGGEILANGQRIQ